jgi:hypothetical protein
MATPENIGIFMPIGVRQLVKTPLELIAWDTAPPISRLTVHPRCSQRPSHPKTSSTAGGPRNRASRTQSLERITRRGLNNVKASGEQQAISLRVWAQIRAEHGTGAPSNITPKSHTVYKASGVC